jgi:hypothetical protein
MSRDLTSAPSGRIIGQPRGPFPRLDVPVSSVALRPRSSSEILDASFQLLRRHYPSFLVIAALGIGPSLVIAVMDRVMRGPMLTGTIARWTLLPRLVVLFWFIIVDAALLVAAADAYSHGEINPARSVRTVVGRWAPLFGASLLKYLYIWLFSMLFIFPVMILAGVAAGVGLTAGLSRLPWLAPLFMVLFAIGGMVWLVLVLSRYFAIPAVTVLEQRGARDSMQRSRALSRSETAKIAKTLILLYIVYGVLLLAIPAVIGFLTHELAIWQIFTTVASMFLYPLVPIATTLLYYDIRIRKEGFDLQLMAAALEPAPATP